MRKKFVLGAGVLVVAAACVAVPLQLTRHAGATATTATAAVETVSRQGLDAILATLSPMATTASQNSHCYSSHCNWRGAQLVATGQTALDSFSDRRMPAWSGPSGTGATRSSMSTQTKARFNPTQVQKRNMTVLSQVFAKTLSAQYSQQSTTYVQSESQWLATTKCPTTGCTLVAGAGQTVTSFTSVVVNGTHATVVAIVHGWQEDGQYVSSSQPVKWTLISGTAIFHLGLTKQSDGTWIITSRQGNLFTS